jgi:two-component system sensor histidine kinase GlrK
VQIPSIVADKEKLYIVLDNLISNAVKYTQNKGTIHIHVHQDKLWQLIEVIDNGPGFNESDQSHIFDPFYQGQALHQGLVQSTGLGLAIAKNLIDAHLGVIMLNPKTKGAHLIVKLPKTK